MDLLLLTLAKIMDLEEAFEEYHDHFDDYTGYLPLDPSSKLELQEELGDITNQDLFRCVAFDDPEDFVKKLSSRGTGLFWTNDAGKARCYYGQGEYYAILQARVIDEKDIDWLGTLEQRMNPQYTGEDEVRLLKGGKVQLKEIEIFNSAGRSIYHAKPNKQLSVGD